MAKRTGDTARDEAFNDMAEALGRYLHALGWTDVGVGGVRIEEAPEFGELVHEAIVRFTGRRQEGAPADDSHGHRRWSS